MSAEIGRIRERMNVARASHGPLGALAALDETMAGLTHDEARIQALFETALLLRDLGEIERAYGLVRELCQHRDVAGLDQQCVLLGLYRDSADEAFLTGVRSWFYARARARRRFVPLRPHLGPARGRLRVGFFGLDLLVPCYAALIHPLLRNLDADRIDALAIVAGAREADLAGLRAAGVQVSALQVESPWSSEGQAEIARQIASLELDVLVDLGECLGPAVELPLHRPAPIQATWQNMLGPCPDPAFDLLIGNAELYPPALSAHYGGKVAHLPADIFAYDPTGLGNPPRPVPPPCLKNGYVTFGSLSNLYKMGDASLALWAKVLHAVPDARLRLGNGMMGDPGVRRRVGERLAGFGVDPARVDFVAAEGWPDYLRAYDGIDVALATVPVAGGTTMFEAIYQGVPVLSRVYPTPLGRIGRWIEAATERPGTAHDSDESLVATARTWAADRQALAAFRAGARDFLAAKASRDARRQARAFEEAVGDIVARRRATA